LRLRHSSRQKTKYSNRKLHDSLQRRFVVRARPCIRYAKKAHRHTKAQLQRVKEGVLDSECEGAAGGKLRRWRIEGITVPGAGSSRQLRINQMRRQSQILRMFGRVGRNWRNRGVLPVDPAAGAVCGD
jgi:hypothetical protein